MSTKPILKWAGGKRQLLSEITGRFPSSYNSYHEPFIGGGAVFFSIAPESGSINDINSRLTNFYSVVQRWPNKLKYENKTHKHSESYYYEAREEFNTLHKIEDKSKQEAIREAGLLLYLNRTCYNGLYRENSDGEFNVPFGDYTNPDWVQAEAIDDATDVLEEIIIKNEDFDYVLNVAHRGDLVYMDPPYQPVSTTADFTEYHADGFGKADQKRLRDCAVRLNEVGVYVIISNSPPVGELYDELNDFTVDTVNATRAINSDGDGRGEVAEVLISNVPSDERIQQTLL